MSVLVDTDSWLGCAVGTVTSAVTVVYLAACVRQHFVASVHPKIQNTVIAVATQQQRWNFIADVCNSLAPAASALGNGISAS